MESKIEVDSTAEVKLRQFFELESETLLKTLRVYVSKAQLSQDRRQIETLAFELLNETFVATLKHPERFDPLRSPRAWVLGIAANLIKQKQKKENKFARHEIEVGDASDEFFEHIASVILSGPEHEVEQRNQLESILNCLSKSDQFLLQVAMQNDLSGKAIAEKMGITEGAARTKLHRALQRAHEIWTEQTQHIRHAILKNF